MGLYDAYVPTPSGDDYPTKIEDFLTIVGTHVTALQAVTPATLIGSPTTNNLVSQTAGGDIQDSGLLATDVPIVVGSPTTDNLAAFDASGNLIDAGRPKADPINTYLSGNLTITQGGNLGPLPHNLSEIPNTSIFIKCTSGEGNYSIGDEVLIMSSSDIAVIVDDTNYNIWFSDLTANAFTIPDNTDGSPLAITNASWVLVIRGIV